MRSATLVVAGTLGAVGLALALLLHGCGESRGSGPGVGDPAVPLIDVSWIPRFKVGTEPSDFFAPPLDGNVVLLEFFASW